MTSWRAVTSDDTQADLDDLLDLALRTAKEHLDAEGEVFLPYLTQSKVTGKLPAQKHRFGDPQAIGGAARVWS